MANLYDTCDSHWNSNTSNSTTDQLNFSSSAINSKSVLLPWSKSSISSTFSAFQPTTDKWTQKLSNLKLNTEPWSIQKIQNPNKSQEKPSGTLTINQFLYAQTTDTSADSITKENSSPEPSFTKEQKSTTLPSAKTSASWVQLPTTVQKSLIPKQCKSSDTSSKNSQWTQSQSARYSAALAAQSTTWSWEAVLRLFWQPWQVARPVSKPMCATSCMEVKSVK